MPLTNATIELKINAVSETSAALDGDVGSFGILKFINNRLLYGLGNNNATDIYRLIDTCPAGSNYDIDLNDLTNSIGETISLANLKFLFLENRAPTAGDVLHVIPHPTEGSEIFTDSSGGLVIRGGYLANVNSGGFLILSATDVVAYTVDYQSSNIIRLHNPGATDIPFDFGIIGVD